MRRIGAMKSRLMTKKTKPAVIAETSRDSSATLRE